MNDYKVLATVGEGAHGIVLKARHIVSGDLVALKKVTLKKISEDGIPVQVIREIKALQCLEHENVVYLIDVFPQGLSFVMVFEFMPSNLWEILDSYKLSGGQAKCYMKMILRGLEYLHSHHIMHRDLKPANLLIADNKTLKIGDFGLCRLYFKDEKTAYSHQVATRWYRAPELLYGARYYDETVDIWSAGAIFAEMLKGSPVFPGENDIDQLYLVISSLGTPNEDTWPGHSELPDYNKISFSKMCPVPLETLVPSDVPGCSDFLRKFLIYDSNKRLSAKNALKDQFFDMSPLTCSIQELPSNPPPKQNYFRGFDSSCSEDNAGGLSASTSECSSTSTITLKEDVTRR
ncbi:unnamed protein product [Orchesella dallaii]|uniref:Cyclin-dependent kinase 20 n=1 Tax=Orchesella dallaii TaxID=48710 RepID=A0ABP1Q679_9HEXA